ncbi:uncharacterized protein LOC121419559 [Lytechinus variegatus]|uniref:uncharacterized protein LOC121419559 n=1 Tax=Lytechinus variegatus TaxID=7654 RepID=UPI001BB1C546|nr:uncharacterized protein LOC121419559 [Lytechinus variegatus]
MNHQVTRLPVSKCLEKNNIINPNQHGFRKGLSCETQLVVAINDWAFNIDKQCQTDAFFLNFSKGFDKVLHTKLLCKLEYYGITGQMHGWIKAFLSGRSQSVHVDGTSSPRASVLSGVPQGSVLGPVLFLLYTNDICECISSLIRLFADDCVLYRKVETRADHAILQRDLSTLSDWAKLWDMSFNVKKCVNMCISLKRQPLACNFTISDQPIPTATSCKYLGVTITDNLSWNSHAQKISSKAARTLGIIRRALGKCDLKVRDIAYKQLVRPQLEYASCAWNPHIQKDVNIIESIQRQGARFVLHDYSRESSVTSMLSTLHWDTLQHRRLLSQCEMFYKIHHNFVYINMPHQIKLSSNSRPQRSQHTGHQLKYTQPFCRVNCYMYSMFPRTIRIWNTLPNAAVTSTSIAGFRGATLPIIQQMLPPPPLKMLIETNVADGNIANLKTSAPIKSLVVDVRNSKQLCDMCDEQSRAAHFCCDCGKSMCNACLQAHNTWKPNLKHKVMSVEDIRGSRVVLKKKVYCQAEGHSPYEYECSDVCTTCKKLICMRCRVFYHEKRGHKVVDMKEYSSFFKRSSVSLEGQGKTKAPTVKNHMTCIDNQIKRVNDHIDGEKSKLDKICEEAAKKIKEINESLNIQLDDQSEQLVHKLKDMKIDDERLVKSIESASDLVSNSLKGPLEGDVVAIRDSLSGELKNVLDRDDPKEKAAFDVGDHGEELTFTPRFDPDTLSIGGLRFVKCEPKCNGELSNKDSMNGMAATKDGMMAIGSRFRELETFSADGQLEETVMKDLFIRELVFLSDGSCVVLDYDNKISLYTSDTEKQDVTFDTLDDSEGGFGGLTADSNDLIYVSYREAKKIQVFLPSGGKAIREIPCDGYEPGQITSYGDSLIVVQFYDTIIRIDRNGDIKHLFWQPMKSNINAAASKDNTILISSVRHDEGLLNIDEYSGELKHIKTLISDYKIEKPKRNWYYIRQFQSGEIAFCTPDRLYIFNLVTSEVTS